MITVIATVDKNWALENKGKALINIPDDIKYFRDTTAGQIVIIDRKILATVFAGHPLPNRKTFVVSQDPYFSVKGAETVKTAEEAIEAAEQLSGDIYVSGSAELLSDILPYADQVRLTWVDYYYNADAYFPNLDKMPEWVMTDESEEQTYFDAVYFHKRYLRRKDYREV